MLVLVPVLVLVLVPVPVLVRVLVLALVFLSVIVVVVIVVGVVIVKVIVTAVVLVKVIVNVMGIAIIMAVDKSNSAGDFATVSISSCTSETQNKSNSTTHTHDWRQP